MGRKGYRINGGVGFAVEGPGIEIIAKQSSSLRIYDKRNNPFSKNGLLRLGSVIDSTQQQYKFCKSIRIEISGAAKTHFGFGTGTAVRLACLEALFIVNDQKYSPTLLRQLSGRGGTSGIGVYTYFRGGIVFDLGHRQNEKPVQPSNLREAVGEIPLLLQQVKMPAWDIGICIPTNIRHKSEKEEKEFFLKTCPITNSEVYKTLYHTTYGLQAAVLEGDQNTFGKAVTAIQNCAWKSAERQLYGAKLADIETVLYKCGASAVGMSSLGPALFFLAENVAQVMTEIKRQRAKCELLITRPSNQGRILSYV